MAGREKSALVSWNAKAAFFGCVIVLAGLLAYHNSFTGPFVFDDQPSIVENESIRRMADALTPPHGQGVTVEGRPVLNVSFALNYAISGTRVWSYHVANLAIHLLAGLALFGIVRRTPGRDRTALAFLASLLWVVHPLQTEAVTYVVQRAESLMGLFFLLTLYFFIRGAGSAKSGWRWHALSVLCCLLGMGTKEVMVAAPALVFLYDRTFIGGSFRAAWERRRGPHIALAATWLLLAGLVLAEGGNRGGSVGFGAGVSWTAYALTQFPAIIRYLRLVFWPHPLVFDYGTAWISRPESILPDALLVAALAGGTAWALFFRPVAGFFGAAFFLILAPTSLLPGTTQMIVEHRMYLPLAAVLIPVAFLASEAAGPRRALFRASAAAAAIALTAATHGRNAEYRTALGLWEHTAAQRPENAVARDSLGNALKASGRVPEAIAQYRAAVGIDPGNARAHNNLGEALKETGQTREAIAEFETALRIAPDFAEAHNNLGNAWDEIGQPAKAGAEFAAALQIRPRYAEANNNLGVLLNEGGRNVEAIGQFEAALRIRPDYAEAHNNLGIALGETGRDGEAAAEYQAALRIRPDYIEAHNNLGNALDKAGRIDAAIAEYESALRVRPDYIEARNNLGNALDQAGRVEEAVAAFETALRAAPGNPGIHYNLGLEYERARRLPEAAAQYETALGLAPDFAAARAGLERLRTAR